jgi:hypothetical protein
MQVKFGGAGEAPSGVRRCSGSHRRFLGRPRDWSVEADRAPRRWVWAAQALLERLPRSAGVAARAPSLADRDDLGGGRLRRCLGGGIERLGCGPGSSEKMGTDHVFMKGAKRRPEKRGLSPIFLFFAGRRGGLGPRFATRATAAYTS